MIVLPTIYRPRLLERFVAAYRQTNAILPIHVVFDAADAGNYNHIQTPEHWKRCSVPTGTPIGEVFNIIFARFPNQEYYGMVADDVIPETQHWDISLRENCLPDKISWGWDGIQNEKLPVHPFIGGDLVRKLGWWSAPGLKHWFVDNVWKNLADSLNCGAYLPNVKMTHHHPMAGLATMDRTYDNQPSHITDQYAYIKFMNEEFHSAIDRVKNPTTTP